MYAEESVDLLQNSGLQFDRHEREGIETVDFAEMLIVSGILLASVVDPDPKLFAGYGSGSVTRGYGSGFGSKTGLTSF
jgi:hypothetical protein